MSCLFLITIIVLLQYCSCSVQTVSNTVFNKDAKESYDGDRIRIDNCSGVIYNGLLVGSNTMTLKISESNISAVEDGALCTQTRIDTIQLFKNKAFPKLTAQMLANCSHLYALFVNEGRIATPGFFESLPSLHVTNFVDVKFGPDEIISSETFKGFKGRYIHLNNPRPRKFSNDAFVKLENLTSITIIGGGDVDKKSPVFSRNTFKNLDHLLMLQLRNTSWGDIKWHNCKNLHVLGLDGPNTQENAEAFFNNFRTHFPLVQYLELGEEYYDEEQRKVVEGIVKKVGGVGLKWNTASNWI